MKVNKGYDNLFVSIGEAVALCTLIVSVGKPLTSYYFTIIIILFVLILIVLGIIDYSRNSRPEKRAIDIEETDQSQSLPNSKTKSEKYIVNKKSDKKKSECGKGSSSKLKDVTFCSPVFAHVKGLENKRGSLPKDGCLNTEDEEEEVKMRSRALLKKRKSYPTDALKINAEELAAKSCIKDGKFKTMRKLIMTKGVGSFPSFRRGSTPVVMRK